MNRNVRKIIDRCRHHHHHHPHRHTWNTNMEHLFCPIIYMNHLTLLSLRNLWRTTHCTASIECQNYSNVWMRIYKPPNEQLAMPFHAVTHFENVVNLIACQLLLLLSLENCELWENEYIYIVFFGRLNWNVIACAPQIPYNWVLTPN